MASQRASQGIQLDLLFFLFKRKKQKQKQSRKKQKNNEDYQTFSTVANQINPRALRKSYFYFSFHFYNIKNSTN